MQDTKVTVVGLGGCGGNLVSKLADARFNRAIFDSSQANKGTFAKDVPLRLLAGGALAGAGKDPSRIIEKLQAEMPEVVEALIPEGTDLAVLVSSTSGGTGSISGQVMLDQVLASKRARAVLCVLVPSHASLADVTNTVSCLKNMQAAAVDNDTNVTMFRVPVEVAGDEGVRTLSSVEQDSLVMEMFETVANLAFSAEGFDQSDLVSFLNPPSLRKIDQSLVAGVSSLEITGGDEEVERWWDGDCLVLSRATLVTGNDDIVASPAIGHPLWNKTVVCYDTSEVKNLYNIRGSFRQILQDTVALKEAMTPKPSPVIRSDATRPSGRKKFEV